MLLITAFRDDTRKLLLFQIRSGLVSSRKDAFLADLLNWCMEEQVAEVVVLTGSSAEERIDEQLAGPQVRYLATGEKHEETFKYVNMIKIASMLDV